MNEKWLKQLMLANSNKNFVKRILEPSKYPSQDLGNGWVRTHEMAWGDDGKGNYFVYPTVVHNEKDNTLKKLSDRSAYIYALQTGEYLKFNSADTADWVSRNYKLLWKTK